MVDDSALKEVYKQYESFGGSKQEFASADFVKFCKDSGLYNDKGNKFNTKPPNRIDFVFTYACVNGEGGTKGNKKMTFPQFLYALKGISHELGKDPEEVRQMASTATPSTNATKADKNRFHDDTSNYTGAHRLQHGGSAIDKQSSRDLRKLGMLSPAELEAAAEEKRKVEETFAQYDEDGSGYLEKQEILNALQSLKPGASSTAIDMVYSMLMKYGDKNGDGKLDPAEFKNAYNRLIEILNTMGSGSVVPEEKALVKAKYIAFANFGSSGASSEEMDSARFKLFCQQLFPSTFPANQDGTTQVDLIYADALRVRKTKKGGDTQARTITFAEFFENAVLAIASKGGITVDDVVGAILQSDGPVAKGATKAESNRFADNVERKKEKSFKAAAW